MGQDFGLLNGDGKLLGLPVSYRDKRTDGMPDSFADVIAPDALVRRVGSVAAPITTLCQLRALALREPEVLQRASALLHIADLVHHNLADVIATDRTLATVSQLCSLTTGDWDRELLNWLGIPHHILPPIVEAPAVIGEVTRLPELAGTPLVASAGHDTAAASAFLANADEGTAFLMSGTWSMLGVATGELLIPEAPARDGLAILGLPHGRWGLFRSLMGLWIIQECRRAWTEQGATLTHEETVQAAEGATHDSLIDPESPRFAALADMPAEIARFCQDTGQRPPEGIGETARTVLAGMALNHALAVECLRQATGMALRELRVVGGGSANALLCQLTADALGLRVVAGPVEATAVGSLLLQAQAVGALDAGPDALRRVAEASFVLRRYEPSGRPGADALSRFRDLRACSP